MRGNAHRMNLLQLREQQEINRQRLREAEATMQNKAGSCLQGRQGYNKGTTLQLHHTMMNNNNNNINNNNRQKKKVSDVSDDVQINVYIRECDTDDEENDFADNGCNGSNDDDEQERNERHSSLGAKAAHVHTYYERGNELIEQPIGSSDNAVRKTNASVATRNTGRLSQYELTRNNCTNNNYDNNKDKFCSHSLSSPLRFGQGENIQTLYSSKRRNTNNKNNNNCYGSTNNMISNELEGKNKHEEFGNPGKVPRYLQRRKDELHAEKEAIAEAVHQRQELAKIPPGQRLVSDDEKCKMLEQFAERKKELELQLSKLPIRFDTENIKNKRRNIYDELSKLEDLERKYSTKKPLYIPL